MSIFSFTSPKNYNELLPKLNQATFVFSLIYFILLHTLGLLPVINISKQLIPPVKDYDEFIAWLVSFGIGPLVYALIALFFSQAFEMHNKFAKTLGIRYLWDKLFIVKPLMKIARVELKLNSELIEQIMNELYYPQVKNIDQHYVELFWRYALPFWILFEHCIIVFITACAVTLLNANIVVLYLWGYFVILIFITSLQLIFVTAQKSTDQARQIPLNVVTAYFNRTFFSKE